MSASNGKEGCRCANHTSVLASLVRRRCTTAEGDDGVLATVSGPCVPFFYGSNTCSAWDVAYDTNCTSFNSTFTNPWASDCSRPWCYVDKSCRLSSERLIGSSYFNVEADGVDLYYSWSTCASGDELSDAEPFGGKSLLAAVPGYIAPFHYKTNNADTILTQIGDEYYDDR